MKRIITLLITLFLIGIKTIYCESKLYNIGDLTCNMINKTYQDANGFIWVATEYGLNRFNGKKFNQYLHNDKDSSSLLGNYVKTIYRDKNDKLWVGCSNGLQYYNPAEDNFTKIEAYSNNRPHINDILEFSSGEFLLATSGFGIMTLDKNRKTLIPKRDITKLCGTNYINCLFLDQKENLWIGTDNNGLIKFNLKTKRCVKYQFKSQIITDIVQDKKGRLFVSTLSSVEFFDEQNNIFKSLKSTANEELFIKDLTVSKNGYIYIGTDGQGLKYIDPNSLIIGTVTTFHSLYNFSKAKIHSILEDNNQNLWLGCYFGGLLTLQNEPTQFDYWRFSQEENKISGAVISICKDYEGYIWACVDNEGLYKYDYTGKTIQKFSNLKNITCIFEDSKKNLWVGTIESGIGVLNKTSGTINYLSASIKTRIKCITEGIDGNLYISAFGNGFMKYNPENIDITLINSNTTSNAKEKISNDWINTMLCDKQGLLWIGHYKGIDCYDIKKSRVVSSAISAQLKGHICLSLLEDNNGRIWIGTNNGLFLYTKKSNKINLFTTSNGLSNNVICGLAEDEDGNVWCSTYEGINEIKSTSLKAINYYRGSGLKDWGYTSGAYFKDKDGVIYFGGNSGVTSFSPQNIIKKIYPKPVIITNLLIRNNSVNTLTLSNGNPIITKQIDKEKVFNFSHLDDTFTFEISTLNFGNQEDIIYEYRILEIDKEWSAAPPTVNTITFNHLSPGKYTLELRASKNGAYSPTNEFTVIITPPWYKSIFAYFLYFTICISLILLSIFLYFRTKQEKFNEAKLQYFINISHEIRSPITLIISPLEKLLKETQDEKTAKILQTVHRNTTRLLGLVNQLLDVRKHEKGQMKIKCNETDLVEFINDLISVFDYQATNKNIQLKFESSLRELPIWIDRNNFDKVLINILSNAFKYTPEGGEITISLKSVIDKSNYYNQQCAEIKITDNGIGIDKDKIEKIFDRFYQIENELTFSSIGSGIGLNLCKILVELHHGTIFASNRKDKTGSCLTIRIPLGNEHLKKEEILEQEISSRFGITATNHNLIPSKSKIQRSKTNLKILIVDDEEEIRNYLKEELEETYKIMTCKNGAEAIQIIHSYIPDLIITDFMMPEADGISLIRKIKANITLSHIPIIMLTAKTEHEDRLLGIEKGADIYLTKPFNVDELFAHVNNLLESRKLLKDKYSGNQEQENRIKNVEFKSSDEILMDKLMIIINDNLSNPDMNVEMLAKSIGLSRVQLHRKLKEITGLPTGEFVRNLRLNQAVILLKEKKMNITQIAYAVGFTNQTHFSTTFKKIYGFSPSEFIDQN